MHEPHGGRVMRQIREICELAGIKAEEYAKVTKKRLDVLSLSREMAREKSALGERVYDLSVRTDPGEVLDDVTVQAILGRIRNLEASLADCEEEIADIRDVAGARAADLRQPAEAAGEQTGTSSAPPDAGQEVREEAPRVDDEFVGEEVSEKSAEPASGKSAEPASGEPAEPASEKSEEPAPEKPPKKTRKRRPSKPLQE
jgi:hypothetical protein